MILLGSVEEVWDGRTDSSEQLTVEGLGIQAVEPSINAPVTVVNDSVNTAFEWALIEGVST